MAYKTREQVEREAAKEAGRLAGAREENARLRPLLKSLLARLEAAHQWGERHYNDDPLLAGLRREIGE